MSRKTFGHLGLFITHFLHQNPQHIINEMLSFRKEKSKPYHSQQSEPQPAAASCGKSMLQTTTTLCSLAHSQQLYLLTPLNHKSHLLHFKNFSHKKKHTQKIKIKDSKKKRIRNRQKVTILKNGLLLLMKDRLINPIKVIIKT